MGSNRFSVKSNQPSDDGQSIIYSPTETEYRRDNVQPKAVSSFKSCSEAKSRQTLVFSALVMEIQVLNRAGWPLTLRRNFTESNKQSIQSSSDSESCAGWPSNQSRVSEIASLASVRWSNFANKSA